MQHAVTASQPARLEMCPSCGAHGRIFLPDGTETEDIWTLERARVLLVGLVLEGYISIYEMADLYNDFVYEKEYAKTFVDLVFDTPIGLKVVTTQRPSRATISRN